ncbi:S8 family serine peptidase [Micrococcus terreus]|uniref:S8 family serine peptidase n=1 Tax=Micrococcus terreus TaxID=574650 RepID=UPI00301A4F6B
MSQNPKPARRRRAITAALAGLPLIAGTFLAPAVAAPDGAGGASSVDSVLQSGVENYKDGKYFVVLKDAPAVTYTGGTQGYAPTAAPKGKFNPNSAHVRKYEKFLEKKQRDVAATEGVQVDRSFSVALNAFTADLTAEQALDLSRNPNVLGVAENTQAAPDYSSTEFLGLPGNKGAWKQTYKGIENAGKGTVVGVIDTGYYPEQDMLTGEPVRPLKGKPKVGEPYLTADGKIAMLKADGTTFMGECEPGEDFTGDECNSKVLSARYYSEDFEAYVPPAQRDPNERLSPIDVSSHGTHTATTAAGNHGVDQVRDDGDFGEGSGVAPAAKVSVYKICWEDTDPNTGGCYTSASVAAIEDAIIDNVDVLNYSISGNNNSVVDPVALAFKSAASAGIFVSASAGNSGPTANTVNHSSPWLTSVAASTFSNEMSGTVEFADGTKVRGVSSMGEGVGPADIVLSSEVAKADANPADAALCFLDTLDPAAVDGKIVVCDRGGNARVEKSEEVANAGGVGMVLVNIGGGSEDADHHSVPTVHTSDESVKAHVASTDVQATLVRGDTTGLPEPAVPQIAGFSSRGPSNAVSSDLLKPDIAAPGVNVMAGVSPLDPNYGGNQYGLMSGTSMAAPNLAGMAALMAGKHPSWSPMAIKSAMMTTTEDVYNADGSVNLDNFATGAGSADPAAMAAPGLVYDADEEHWNAFLVGEIAARDVNVPSYAVSNVAGSATVTRTVTALENGRWSLEANVPGFTVTASPSTLNLKRGQSAEVEVTFTRDGAEANTWKHGSLTWAGGKKNSADVTSAVTLRAVDVAAPSSVTGSGASGSTEIELTGGVTGTVSPSIVGLTKAVEEDFSKAPGALYGGNNASNHLALTDVEADTTSVTWSLLAADDASDWDMFVITPAGRTVQVATASASERLTLTNPAPGTYAVVSNLYDSPNQASTDATLQTVKLTGDEGNLTVTPNPISLTQGEKATVTASWSGLTEGSWHGVITWTEGISTAVTIEVGADGTTTVTDVNGRVLTPEQVEAAPLSDLVKQ